MAEHIESKHVRLSKEVIEHVSNKGQFGDSFDTALRRILKLPILDYGHEDTKETKNAKKNARSKTA